MIIDVHAHLGWDCVFDVNFTLEDLRMKHERYGVTKSILQPGTCHDIESVRAQHDKIFEVASKYPGEYYGMANPNPHLSRALYKDEIKRCITELGFIGVKLHPTAHAVNPGSIDGKMVFETAMEYGIPVMVHTGAGIPFSNPANLIPIAKKFPDLKIIMAHSGAMISAGEVPIVLASCLNVYADLSWTGGHLIKHWADTIGAHRFMFASDHAENTGCELTKLKECGINEDQLEWILHKTAESVFELE